MRLKAGFLAASGERLWHGAEARHDLAADAGDAHLEALEVGERLDLLAEPAAHLHAGVAAREVADVVFFQEIGRESQAPARIHPGVLLARSQPERHGARSEE